MNQHHHPLAYLTDGAVPARLHVVFTLVAGVDEAVLALVVQLHQHTHGAPLAPPQRAELPVLVPGQGEEGVTAVHQVAGQQGVWIHDRGEGVDRGSRVQMDHKEHLRERVEREVREGDMSHQIIRQKRGQEVTS